MLFDLWPAVVVVLQILAVSERAAAQISNAVCITDNWAFNSRGQSPCLVTAYLQAVCNSGQFTVVALTNNTHYTGPDLTNVNPCQCSTVTYSMISACGACQNATWISWSSWGTNCTTIYDRVFPYDIPGGTAIPSWAYLNVVPADDFSPTAAAAAGDSPESTATRIQSTGSGLASSTSIASLTSGTAIATASPSVTASSHKSNVGAIAGGVVGGVVGLAAITAIVAFFIVRQRRSKLAPSTAYHESVAGAGKASEYTGSTYQVNPFLHPQSPTSPPKLYNPSDPSTFPTSPPTPTIHTTGTHVSAGHSQSQITRPGQYTGVPEI